MSWFIRFAVLLCISQSAFARVTTEEEREACAQFLSQSSRPIDYAFSDLEGLFFDLIKKVQASNEVPQDRAEFYVKDVLSMKAQVLNNVMYLLAAVEKPETLGSIYQMLDSLGVDPEMYGLKLDDQNRLMMPKRDPAPANVKKVRPVNKRTIGFLKLSPTPLRDLPEGLHRSIGFGPQHVEGYAPPARVTGQIRRAVSPKNQNIMIFTDGETKSVYQADRRILNLFGVEFENQKYTLQFNNEMSEWVVVVENLANPTNRIGF